MAKTKLSADQKIELCEKAIDVLIELAEAGMGNWQTSDALTWVNRKRSEVSREQEKQEEEYEIASDGASEFCGKLYRDGSFIGIVEAMNGDEALIMHLKSKAPQIGRIYRLTGTVYGMEIPHNPENKSDYLFYHKVHQ